MRLNAASLRSKRLLSREIRGPSAPLLAFEKWPADNQNLWWRQHRGPLLKKREKWRTPRLCHCNVLENPNYTFRVNRAHPPVGTFAGSGTCYATVKPSGGTYTWEANFDKGATTISLSCTTSGCSSSDNFTAIAPSNAEDDTSITVFYTYNGQEADDTSDHITVHQPTSLRTNSTTPTTTTCTLPCLAAKGSCATKSGTSCNFSAPETQRSYSVLDQFGNAYEDVNLSSAPVITEQVNQQKTTCGTVSLSKGDTGGSPFTDTLHQCASCCESGGPGCTSTYNQTISSNSIQVRAETISTTCTSVTPTP